MPPEPLRHREAQSSARPQRRHHGSQRVTIDRADEMNAQVTERDDDGGFDAGWRSRQARRCCLHYGHEPHDDFAGLLAGTPAPVMQQTRTYPVATGDMGDVGSRHETLRRDRRLLLRRPTPAPLLPGDQFNSAQAGGPASIGSRAMLMTMLSTIISSMQTMLVVTLVSHRHTLRLCNEDQHWTSRGPAVCGAVEPVTDNQATIMLLCR